MKKPKLKVAASRTKNPKTTFSKVTLETLPNPGGPGAHIRALRARRRHGPSRLR